MADTFADVVAEVTGIVPGYSSFLAKRDVEKAWRDLLRRRTWSFLIQEGGMNAPPLIQVGSVTITENSTAVVADTVAAAALNAAVTQVPVLTLRQFRISTAGAIYNIMKWDNATRTLTVDRPILEQSAVTSSYMVYQCYFPPPPQALQPDGSYDFDRWISVMDPINGWTLKDNKSKAWLDQIDPQRATTDLAYRYVDYKSHPQDAPFFEFWPHPTSGQEYQILYKARGLAFVNGLESIPQCIESGLLVDRTLYKYAYRWAQVNAGRDSRLAKTNWSQMIRDADALWKIDLQAAKMNDENVHMEALIGPLRRRFGPPVDSNFLQSHSTGLEPFI